MKIRYEFAGTNATEKHLLIYFEIVTGSTRRVETILVPWSEITDQKYLHQIDQQVRKELRAAWEGRDELGVTDHLFD